MTVKYGLGEVSDKDLIKVICLISLVIIGALGSLFLIGTEFIIIELIVSLNWILLGLLWGLHMPLKIFAYEGICLIIFIKRMVMVTF